MDIGRRFQKETKYTPEGLRNAKQEEIEKPPLYKTYPDAKTFNLPDPKGIGELRGFMHLLETRKSVRKFAEKPMGLEELSYLLWASTGIQRNQNGRDFRTIPSAGARFPIESYVIAHNVRDLPQGLYHYNIKEHKLVQLREEDLRQAITDANLGQKMSGQAPAIFLWSAIFDRTCFRYSDRGYRYIYLDAGHVGHSFALAAHSIDMATTQIGAYLDGAVDGIVGLDGEYESVIYQSVVGYPPEE